MMINFRFGSGLFLVLVVSDLQAQEDSLSVKQIPAVRAFRVGAGAIFFGDKVQFDPSLDVVFRNGWGLGTDFHSTKEYFEPQGPDSFSYRSRAGLFTLRLTKQFISSSDRWNLQVGIGPSYGKYNSSVTDIAQPGQAPQPEVTASGIGVGSRINLMYKVTPWAGVSAGAYVGYNTAFDVRGPTLSVVLGVLGRQSVTEKALLTRSLSDYSYNELIDLEIKNRREGMLGTVAGGVLTGLALVVNVLSVREYHSADTWSRLGGVTGLALTHLALAPAGTGLLIWGGIKRGKAQQIRLLTGAESGP